MKLIVALGNPGKEYEKTRHNAGWIAIDILIDKYGYEKVKFEKQAHIYFSFINNEKVLFIKPQSYMNNSGIPVKEIMSFYKVGLKDLIILHDEKDFFIEKTQFKFGGSSAGHNGIKSLIKHLGSEKFLRYRIGINPPPENWLIIDWVLSKFSDNEIEIIKKKTYDVSDFIFDWSKNSDLNKLMSKYN